MRPISEATSRVTGNSFSRKYISLGRIVNCWREIVGPQLATKAQPIKINYHKRDKQQSPSVTLDIATTSADATSLHYQKDLILERINQIFGDKWITAIRFVTIAANAVPKKPKKKRIPLTEDEKNHLSDMLKSMPDEGLRNRLENLGQAILTESKNESSSKYDT